MTLSDKNKKILKISAVFTITYTIFSFILFETALEIPVIDDIISSSNFLYFIFFFPIFGWFLIRWTLPMNWALPTTWIIAGLCYAIFLIVFWLINFLIIKIIVRIKNSK